MRFTIQAIICAFAAALFATQIAANPVRANDLACYYKRDASGEMVGYRRDESGSEIACAASAAE
ncbi:MAG: hypothetical protein M1813_007270 [Trichoglossum hirsutum]|nr:MAG: hypothetical protein M1813_007270 [Trichoglossum hirsutum]